MTKISRKAAIALFFLCASIASAQVLTLYNFDRVHGSGPKNMKLVQGPDASLYGTTAFGGRCQSYCGTVFKINPNGAFRTLYKFCTPPACSDGSEPQGGLALGVDRHFYGTDPYGGGFCSGGCGSVYEVTSQGAFTKLYSFGPTQEGANGARPFAGLTLGTDDNFYGVTTEGGKGRWYPYGTIFEITPDGTENVLYSFCYHPMHCERGPLSYSGGLLLAQDENFYGLSQSTIFRFSRDHKFATIYDFVSESPTGGLIQATDGNFYGTTSDGGDYGHGSVYKFTPEGVYTTLYSFCAQGFPLCADGYSGNGLTQGTDGNFYGSNSGGINGGGTIFQLTPDGVLSTLFSFCNFCDDGNGDRPNALMQATDGDFYGTTFEGGANEYGTVFKLSMGLDPFVEALPGFGKAGRRILIFGTDLADASSVSFNGTPATFTVISATELETSVPLGATGGSIEVMTPTGTLVSNVPFIVTGS